MLSMGLLVSKETDRLGTPMALPLFSTGRERRVNVVKSITHFGQVGSTVTPGYKSTNPISHKSARNMLADWLAQETRC